MTYWQRKAALEQTLALKHDLKQLLRHSLKTAEEELTHHALSVCAKLLMLLEVK